MSSQRPHICVCICTYKRPEFLLRLLKELDAQETEGLFDYSVVVADNDATESGRSTVNAFTAGSSLPVVYCVESRQNIALARNKAIENTHGDYVAFIDDDEFPIRTWLVTLFKACVEYKVQGVLGPVNPHFEETAPAWIVKGKFYRRASYPTGMTIDWRKGRTGNVLLKRELFQPGELPFQPEFRQGEDQDFFRRMIEKGHRFVWCHEAVAYESVPPVRWKRSFLLRRALLRGSIEPKTAEFGFRSVLKSILAVLIYVPVLPFALLFGQARFMEILVSLFDHLGKLLAVVGINPIQEAYVTE
ncbi:MAG: glycosyltransferase family 2 protein [Bryobacteraceae bacterium]